jgi:hypothetical protein
VDPVPDQLLLRKCGSAGNRSLTSESVAKNSDHWTKEAVETDYSRSQFSFLFMYTALL